MQKNANDPIMKENLSALHYLVCSKHGTSRTVSDLHSFLPEVTPSSHIEIVQQLPVSAKELVLSALQRSNQHNRLVVN